MEASLSLQKAIRPRNMETNLNHCIVCQKHNSPYTSTKDAKLTNTSQGLKTLHLRSKERQKYNDHDFIDFHDRLQKLDVEQELSDIKWHRACYSNFTNISNVKRLRKRFECYSTKPTTKTLHLPKETNTPELDSVRLSRQSHSAMNWDKCIFCQTDKYRQALRDIQSLTTSSRVIELSQNDPIMMYRVSSVNDLSASGGKYHLQCYSSFVRKNSHESNGDTRDICFCKAMEELRQGLHQGEVYSINTVWTRYCELQTQVNKDAGDYHSRNFKTRISRYLTDEVEFVRTHRHKELLLFPNMSSGLAFQHLELVDSQSSTEEDTMSHSTNEVPDMETEVLSWLYRVALKIRGDIAVTPGHDFIGGLDQTHVENIVPESLYLLLRLICPKDANIPEVNSEEDSNRTTRILSIAQDIVFLASGGRKKTPKHIALGITIHQATRSKKLVQLLHSAGHSISYESVLQVDTSLVAAVLQHYQENGHIFIPSNITNLRLPGYIRFANDNIDINEETLDGKGTFHASQSAIFVTPAVDDEEPPLNVKFLTNREAKVPPEFQQLKESSIGTKQPEPAFFSDLTIDMFKPNENVKKSAQVQDMLWLVTRSANIPEQHVPAWTAFNQMLDVSGKDTPVSRIGHLPIINAPAHEYDVIWTVINRSIDITKALGQEFTIITFDEQLYSKAKQLQWFKPEECQNVIIMLGGFHTQMNFSKVIGQHMMDSGLKDIWVDSGVFGENTADKILQGKGWNRIIRAHKLTVDALWRILWPSFEAQVISNSNDPYGTLKRHAELISSGFHDKKEKDIHENVIEMTPIIKEMMMTLDAFDNSKCNNQTYLFWRQYMELTLLLLRFTRALRSGNWELYLTSLAEMIPWFALYDHTHYTRWATVFLADAKELPTRAPCVYNGFLNGDFVVKETSHKFNQIPDDQGLEHINKLGKVAGGLVGITRTDTARDRWSVTYNDRMRLAQSTWAMFGLQSDVSNDVEWDHKELGPSRLKRDESDVLKLKAELELREVFTKESLHLVNIATGDVATADISDALLNASVKGQERLNQFIAERLINKKISFHKVLHKTNSKTFESLYSVSVTTEKQKILQIKADRNIFQRLVVAIESGRDIDLDTLLMKELSPVPLSLANTDGSLRATNKSQLGHILEDGHVFPSLPKSALSMCMIIDGMALVHAIGKSSSSVTFGDISDTIQCSIVTNLSDSCSRVDVIFDQYNALSIKSGTRNKRKKSRRPVRRIIDGRHSKLPDNWQNFLALDENKADLVNFLSTELSKVVPNKGCELIVSGGFSDPKQVLSSKVDHDVSNLSSTQEEADTRIILHACEASHSNYKKILIAARDTDVMVLLLAFRNKIAAEEIWMKSGTNQKPKYIAIHSIPLEDLLQRTILQFHALTGTDTTSQFASIGKKTAWKVFCNDDNAKLLENLGTKPLCSPDVANNVEAFVCKLYKPTCTTNKIQTLRSSMFRMSKKALESLPPTQDALLLHINRVNHQAFIWRNAAVAQIKPQNPLLSGWKKKNHLLLPLLMTQEPVPENYLQLSACGCSRGGYQCRNRQCMCTKAGLRCTAACACGQGSDIEDDWCKNPNNGVGMDENNNASFT